MQIEVPSAQFNDNDPTGGGLRLFDAVALGGNTAGLGGGFTLTINSAVPVPVPAPSRAALPLLALPGIAWAARRRLVGVR